MRKIFCFIAALIMAGMNLLAADVIVLRNSTRIDAKILEVSDTEIKYKKADNLNGPTFIQKVEGISAIIYENGDVSSYADLAPAQNHNSQQTSKASNSSSNKTAEAQKESKFKLQFNPQPSDKYWFGLTIGYMSKNMKATYMGTSAQGSFVFGAESGKTYTPAMRFGFTMNPTFKYGIGMRTGIFMEYGRDVWKGAAETPSGDDTDLIGHDVTLSVPLQISYRYEIIPKLSVMLYTCPIFDFGAFCTVTYAGDPYSKENGYAHNLSTGNAGYSGFNCLWGIGAGVQWDRLRLDIGGDFGMVNKSPESGATLNWNKPVYVTLTCFF